MIKILLSKKLGELRLTQADLARATGIRPNTINELYHELAERVSRLGKIVRSMITMKRYVLENKKNYFMRLSFRSVIKIIWDQKRWKDNLLQRY